VAALLAAAIPLLSVWSHVSCYVQVLSKDLLTVRQLVEDVVAQLGGSAGGASLSGAAVHDTCAAVDTMHDNHLHSLLPRVRACDSAVVEFLLRCSDAKTRMTADVLEQLQGIAAQQSRIRDMKHKLAVFNEVLTRQAAAFAELQTATRWADGMHWSLSL
jgi:hypothetical protein